jgi:DNA-directed RNA polymerase subunit beta
MLQMDRVRDFSKVGDAAPIPNLMDIQIVSYARFLQEDAQPERRRNGGLESLLREIFPIVSYDGQTTLEYLYYELGEPRYSPQECRDLRLTYGKPFRIRCRLVRKDSKDVLEESIYLGEIPIMVGGGEFIINGAERVIVSQLHRSPGVDFTVEMQESDRPLHGARIIPERGSWIELGVTKKDSFAVRIDQSGKIPATTFLRAMDEKYGTSSAIIREFYETKTIPIDSLQPQMYLVGGFVDPESGEELVPAGGQVGEALSRIIIYSITDTGRKDAGSRNWSDVENSEARAWIKENLEYKTVVTQKQNGEPLGAAELNALEGKLVREYPDDVRGHKWPRFNGESVSGRKAEWTKELEGIFEKCKACIASEKGWREVDNWTELQAQQGVYFYRYRATKRLGDGYIGQADVTAEWKGLLGRIKHHYQGSMSDDNLLKVIAKEIVGREKARVKNAIRELEVIEKVSDELILNTLAEDPADSHENALLRIYMRLRPGNPPHIDKAKTLFKEKFYDENRYRLSKVGRFRINRKFKQDVPESVMTLRPEDFLGTLKYIVKLRAGEGYIDDIDHLGNRRLRTIDELAMDELRKGFLKLRRTVQERMSLKDISDLAKIAELVNSKSISSSVDYFFGRGELSQVVDQQNPLSQLTHERRLSALGPGGLNRKRAGFEVRDVHISHYGRICPIETPEGNNIGLISSLSIYAGVDEYGFLTTPYRKVSGGSVAEEVIYLRADEEMESVLAPPDVLGDDARSARPRLPKEHVLARVKGELSMVAGKEVGYLDISPKQTVGVSAAMIPFLEHDDANRALMGSNMMRQAVPLLRAEPPIVATGMERPVVENSGMVVKASKAGAVTYVDAERIIIENSDEYELRKFQKLNERACLNQKPVVHEGQRVKKGQIIADGSACRDGELALGRNVLVAFMPFDGHNFEDAVLISERLVKGDTFTSVHMEEYEVEVRETKLGREEFTRDIPNVSEKALRNLDENGVVRVGTRVGPSDILVGKVSPKSKSELTPEEKLLHAIFGRAGEDVKNDSLELPAGEEGVVVDTRRFSRRMHMTDQQRKDLRREIADYRKKMNARMAKIFRIMAGEINEVVGTPMVDPSTRQKVGQSDNDEVILEQIESFTLKWAKARNAAAQEQAQNIHNKYWPRIEEIRKEMNRKLEHMKRGDELPSGVLEMVKVRVATKRALGVGDKMAGRHGNKGVIGKILPEEDMPFLADGTSVDLLLNPLGVPGRMNLGQILETHLGWAAAVLGFQAITPVFDGATEEEIFACLREANEHVRSRSQDIQVIQQAGDTRELLVEMPHDGKITLHDGRTGEPFEQQVTVGYIYMNKLHHLVDEKIHARATGPYSLITQQPLGGKARTGGQRFGEMEVWGLEAYGASYTLQELLTVKSDDVEGRTKIYESMVKGTNTLEAGTPVSFDVLCNELRGLGLNVQLEKKRLI